MGGYELETIQKVVKILNSLPPDELEQNNEWTDARFYWILIGFCMDEYLKKFRMPKIYHSLSNEKQEFVLAQVKHYRLMLDVLIFGWVEIEEKFKWVEMPYDCPLDAFKAIVTHEALVHLLAMILFPIDKRKQDLLNIIRLDYKVDFIEQLFGSLDFLLSGDPEYLERHYPPKTRKQIEQGVQELKKIPLKSQERVSKSLQDNAISHYNLDLNDKSKLKKVEKRFFKDYEDLINIPQEPMIFFNTVLTICSKSENSELRASIHDFHKSQKRLRVIADRQTVPRLEKLKRLQSKNREL